MIFADRADAGRRLAQELMKKASELAFEGGCCSRKKRAKAGGACAKADFAGVNGDSVVVLALPRGGVPVGYEIAAALGAGAEFDLIVTHKLGAPGNEEFAIGAVAEDGSVFLDSASVGAASKDYIEAEKKRQLAEIKKRVWKYRGGRPLPDLRGRTVILVDDGIATGNTMKAAIALAKNAKARRVIVAVPVLPLETLADLRRQTEVVYLETPDPFLAIGRFYEDFAQLTDEEVCGYLDRSPLSRG